MTFVPRHRKKRHPLDRQVLGVYKAPPTGMPDCRCSHRWQAHVPVGTDGRGECNNPRCNCQGYRAVGTTGEDT